MQMWAVVPVDCRARWSSGKCSRRTLRWFTSGSSTTESERSAARCAACNMRHAPYNTEDANRQVARFSTRCPYRHALRRAVVSVKIVASLRGVCDAVAPEATATVCADHAAASAQVESFGYGSKGWLLFCFQMGAKAIAAGLETNSSLKRLNLVGTKPLRARTHTDAHTDTAAASATHLRTHTPVRMPALARNAGRLGEFHSAVGWRASTARCRMLH